MRKRNPQSVETRNFRIPIPCNPLRIASTPQKEARTKMFENIYLNVAICAVIGYLLGCISSGTLIAKIYAGTDIRKTGSGNTGTTNVLRTLGYVPSILTLVGDCLKGVLAAWIGKMLGGEIGMLAGGLFAVLGHDFPVFMKFKGGKGIATSLGITIIICPPVAPWLVVIALGLLPFIRIMSICSMAATVAYPILYYFLLPEGANMWLYMPFAIFMAALSVFCHRSNIVRLIKGQENKLDFGKINKISKKFMKSHKDQIIKK